MIYPVIYDYPCRTQIDDPKLNFGRAESMNLVTCMTTP